MDYLTKIKTSDQFIKEFEEIRRIKTDKDIEAGLDEISKRTPAVNKSKYESTEQYMKNNKDNMEMLEERRLKNDSIRDKLAYLDNQIEYYEKEIERYKEFIKKGDHVDIHKGTIENYKLRIEVLKKDKEYLNTLQHLSRREENPHNQPQTEIGSWGYEGVTYYPQFKTYDEALVAEQNYQNKTLDQLIEHMKRMQTQLDKHNALLTNELHKQKSRRSVDDDHDVAYIRLMKESDEILKKMKHTLSNTKTEGGRKTKKHKNKTTQKKYKKNRRTKSYRK